MEHWIIVAIVVVVLFCYFTLPQAPDGTTENFPNTPYTVPYMREKISPDAWRASCLYKPYPMQVQKTFTLT